MQKIALALLGALVIVPTSASAQNIDDLGHNGRPLTGREHPVEVQIVENTWYNRYPSLYSVWGLIPRFSQQILAANRGAVIAEPTARLLAENQERLDLEAAKFVDANSSIFERRSMRPAEWFLRVSLTGSATTDSQGVGVRVGSTRVGLQTEGGTSTAIARFELIRRRDMVTIATETVRKVYSSTNIVGLSADRFGFFSRSQALAFSQSSNGGYRRGLVSTGQVLEASTEAIRKLLEHLP